MMKAFSLRLLERLVVLPLGVLFMLAGTSALAAQPCEGLVGCDQKACQIGQQLAVAKAKGNKHKVSGLQKALKANQKNCSNEGLRKDLLDEIAESKHEMAKDQAKLNKAVAEGKPHKVRKYQKEVEEEKNELNQLEKELSELDGH